MSATRVITLLGIGAIAFSLPALAQLTPLATDLPISSTTDKNRQVWPAAGLSAAGTRLAWEDDSLGIVSSVVTKPELGAGTPTVLAANDPFPKLPFHATLHEQHQPALAVQSDGSFLLVWTEDTVTRDAGIAYQDTRTWLSSRVLARRFAADGQPQGEVVEIASGKGTATRPALAAAGDIWIAWEQSDDAAAGVHFRSLDAKGRLGKDVLAGAGGRNAALAVAGSTILVAWDHSDQQTSQVFARLYKTSGTSGSPLGTATKVGAGELSTGIPAAAGGREGEFFLTWQGGPDANFGESHVYGQLLRQKGSSIEAVGSPRLLSTGNGNRQLTPAVAPLADGSWLAGWVSWNGFVPLAVDVVTLDATGAVAGKPVRLNDRKPFELGTIAMAAQAGQVWASWVSAGPDGHPRIRARVANIDPVTPPTPAPAPGRN